jgi:hypothetical protein
MKIKIGGIMYEVTKVKNLARDRGCLGECCVNSAEIHLDEELSENLADKVLLHEIIEAINLENEMELKHRNITILESSLYQVLIDNPEIFKHFWK